MAWTKWRKLAEGEEWYAECFDHEGPACYELAIAGPRGGNLQIMYVGETGTEDLRLSAYGTNGSHLREFIGEALGNGWSLWYRAQAKSSKKEAKRMQDNLLAAYPNSYPWNRVRPS